MIFKLLVIMCTKQHSMLMESWVEEKDSVEKDVKTNRI